MMEGPGADSEEKRVLASDLDTVTVDSLKALDLSRPIREADIGAALRQGSPGVVPGVDGSFRRIESQFSVISRRF
jgi:hypothetical protein